MKLPQCTIRDLFWLVLVAAIGCGWWLDHLQIQRLQNVIAEHKAMIQFLGLDIAIKETRERNERAKATAYAKALAQMNFDMKQVPLPPLEVVPQRNSR